MDRLGLCDWIVEACLKLRLNRPFPIQERTIPLILAGKHVLGSAPTGEGKTAAYTLPTLQRFSENPHALFALVAAPTRELAVQINEQFLSYGQRVGLKSCLAIGGRHIIDQKRLLCDGGGAHLLVGTPGRIRELAVDVDVKRRLRRTKVAIFDECDKLIEPPTDKDMKVILDCLSPSCQKLLFSATVTAVEAQLKSFFQLDSPGAIEVVDLIREKQAKPPAMQHRKILCTKTPLLHLLHYLLDNGIEPFAPQTFGIIFTRCVEECELISGTLAKLGYSVCALHSAQPQKTRNKTLREFKAEMTRILVATDVASRGLDIPVVDWVINIGAPMMFEDYVHRVGRCARAMRAGTAVTFVVRTLVKEDADLDIQANRMKDIEKQLGFEVEELEVDEERALRFSRKVSQAHIKAKAELEFSEGAERLLSIRKRRRKERSADRSRPE